MVKLTTRKLDIIVIPEFGTDKLEPFRLDRFVVAPGYYVDIAFPTQVEDTRVDTADPAQSKEKYIFRRHDVFVALI